LEQDLENSIKNLDQAIKLDPKNHYAYKSRAFSKLHSNKGKEAFDDIRQAIDINPAGEYIDNLAQFYSEIGDTANALKYYQKAAETEPDNARLWYNYGVELMENKEYQRAYEMYKKAVELWPQYPDANSNIQYLLDAGLVKRK
jgi:Tfp pilus assembly protein PilF